MSGWSRTVKPHADTTRDPEKLFGVDGAEMAVTPGPAHAGWIYRKLIGARVVYETLVAMKSPPVEADPATDDAEFPNA